MDFSAVYIILNYSFLFLFYYQIFINLKQFQALHLKLSFDNFAFSS